MTQKPTYEELERRVKDLEKESLEFNKAEQVLKSERDKLKTLLDGLASTNIGVDIVTADYEVLQQNQTLINRFGDIVGKKCYKEYMSLDEPCSFCPMVKALENNRLERTELRAADGRDYELLAAPLTNPDGTVDKAIEVVQDITERKRTEKALRESENKYRRLAENSPDMIYRMSLPDGKYEYVSPAATAIFGYPPDAWYENPLLIQEIIPSDWHPYFKDQWDRLLKGDVPLTYEYQIIHKDRTVGWVNQRNVLVSDEDGSPVAIEGIVTDITERKQVEEALHQYEHIVSSSTDMLALLDKRFNYLAANKAYIEAFKLTPEQLIGNTVADVFGKGFFNTVIKPHGDRCLGGEEINYQDWFDFPAHGRRYMDVTYYPYYGEDNMIMGFVVNGRNITERKQTEEEREKLINELQVALKEIKTLRGILPLCSFCKKIRDDKGYWEQVDVYIHKHLQADISHGICPECAKEHYPDLDIYDD